MVVVVLLVQFVVVGTWFPFEYAHPTTHPPTQPTNLTPNEPDTHLWNWLKHAGSAIFAAGPIWIVVLARRELLLLPPNEDDMAGYRFEPWDDRWAQRQRTARGDECGSVRPELGAIKAPRLGRGGGVGPRK